MWALIIIKFKVDFSKVQPTPTLDYMFQIIISSCCMIFSILSIRKWNPRLFWSKFSWNLTLSDSYKIHSYKEKGVYMDSILAYWKDPDRKLFSFSEIQKKQEEFMKFMSPEMRRANFPSQRWGGGIVFDANRVMLRRISGLQP